MEKIRLHGNFLHNVAVITGKKVGDIVVVSESLNHKTSDYLPCLHCLGFFVGTELSRQAEFLFTAGRSSSQLVTTKMRELARLLLAFRKLKNDMNLTLADALVPRNFDCLVEATREVAGFVAMSREEAHDNFEVPSLALKIGYGLKRAAEIDIVKALKEDRKASLEERRNFLTVYDNQWSRKVSSPALISLKEKKEKKDVALPLTEDIRKLTSYIDDELKDVDCAFLVQPAYWKKVAELVSIRLLLLNKRRQAEPFKLTVEEWQRSKAVEPFDEVTAAAFSELEKQVSSKMLVPKVRGKRLESTVPLLVPRELEGLMDAIVKNRHCAPGNRYVFAQVNGLGKIGAFDARNNVIASCSELQHPDRLAATNLRKYVATVSQVLQLDETELGWVSKHLGHSIDVHRKFYRLHQDAIELSKVGKLLMAIETGNVTALKGKKLDDIDYQDINIVDEVK
jgi:hypothetical protein